MVTPRFTRPGPAVALMASLAAALLASSCGWLAGDVFPAWVPFVDGRADLAAVADEADIGTIRYLPTVEYAPMKDSAGADASKVLVYIQGLDGEALAAFEPDGLGVAKTWVRNTGVLSSLGPRLIPTPDGFIAGNLKFNASDLDADPTPVSGGTAIDGFILSFGDPVSYYVLSTSFDTDKHYLKINKYDQYFADLTDPPDIELDLPGFSSWLIDAEFFMAADYNTGMLRILVSTSYGAYAFSFSCADEEILNAAPPELTGPLPMNDGRGWLTADGAVTLVRYDDRSTLARFSYGTITTTTTAPVPLDSLTFSGNTEDFNVASFSADGDRWYLYDGLRKLLYAMRTWW